MAYGTPRGFVATGNLWISFALRAYHVLNFREGRVAEWLMAPVLKTGVPERVSGVRIPPLPPDLLFRPKSTKKPLCATVCATFLRFRKR